MRQTMTVLAALVTLATATAGPATRPAPTSMTVDELRRELVTLRRENAELRARLDRLEAPADGEPKRKPMTVSQAIKAGRVIEGMTVRQARAACRGAAESREGDTYTWTWTRKETRAFFSSNADAAAWRLANPHAKFFPSTRTETVVVRRVVAMVDRGKVVSVDDQQIGKADQ